MWDNTGEPDRFGNFAIDAVLNEEAISVLEQDGIAIREKNDQRVYVFKKPSKSKAGKDMYPIPVYDVDGERFEGIVPNGTKADITYDPFAWTAHFGSGVKGRIKAVYLKEVVEPFVRSESVVSDI
jgi:hypothetical protein